MWSGCGSRWSKATAQEPAGAHWTHKAAPGKARTRHHSNPSTDFDLPSTRFGPTIRRTAMTTTNTSASANGPTRKTLASQLDRLDGILDALGEGLNEAVAQAVQQAVESAVREGVHHGVRGALNEILTNPEVLAVLRAALAPEAPVGVPPAPPPERSPSAGAWGRLKSGCARASGAVLGTAKRCAATARNCLHLVRPFRAQLLTALGVGAAAGVAAYFAGPWVAAGAGWVVGFGTALAVQARRTLKGVLALAGAPGS